MNSSIALRLLWKEYRVQRGLWLAMAFGCFLLQGVVAYLMPSGKEVIQAVIPIGFMLTFFYAIGSGAITFAIEREDGTQLRPVMLGCPPGLTLTVKTLFGVVTTALLLALTVCSGMLLSAGSLTLPEIAIPLNAQRMIVPLVLLYVVLPYLGCLLWSTFFSLLARKVIVALGLAAVAMIGSYIVLAMTTVAMIESGQRNQPHQVAGVQMFVAALIPCFLATSLLAINYLLTHRWLTRVFFDQTSARRPSFFRRWRIRRSGLDGGMIVEIGVEDRTAFEVVSPEVAVHQPPPRFGLSLLYATWGPNLWRHLRFLRWKEALETRRLYAGFILVTLILTFWCLTENTNGSGWHGVVGFFIHAACVACGAMAFRTEQDERKVQRLADMGLRPATVWLSKHLVWLARAVLSVAAILFCVLFVSWLYPGDSSRMRVDQFFDGVFLNTYLPHGLRIGYEPGLRLIGRAAILLLTMYGVGQACSQLIRSTIVSMFAAFILALTAFGWAGVCWRFDVPFILSVLPLAIGCLLVTWFRTNSWMKDDNCPRTWTWSIASLVAALSIMYFGTGLFRVYEIPWSKPFFSDKNLTAEDFDDGLTDEQRAAVLEPVTDAELAVFKLYQRVSDLRGNKSFRLREDGKTAGQLWDALSESDQDTAEEAIRVALEAAEAPECADFSPATTNIADVATSNNTGPFFDAHELILFAAQRQTDNGNLDVALDHYRLALSVSQHAAGRGGENNWRSSHALTDWTLRRLQAWADHPEVDRTLIDEAMTIIDNHRKQMIPIEVANYATAMMIRNTLEADAFTIAELVNDTERLPILMATKFPGELARSHRLLNALESYDVKEMESFRSQQAEAANGSAVGMSQWFMQAASADHKFEDAVRSSVQTTPLFAKIASGAARDHFCVSEVRTDCEIRATKIVMRLLHECRESGELPATLAEFGASWNDPWTGKPFIWYQNGLPGNLVHGSQVLVEANTPFLMTSGKGQTRLRRVEYHENDQFHPAIEHSLSVNRDDSPESELKERADEIVRVDYRAERENQIPATDIRVWKLPKNFDNGDGVGESNDVD